MADWKKWGFVSLPWGSPAQCFLPQMFMQCSSRTSLWTKTPCLWKCWTWCFCSEYCAKCLWHALSSSLCDVIYLFVVVEYADGGTLRKTIKNMVRGCWSKFCYKLPGAEFFHNAIIDVWQTQSFVMYLFIIMYVCIFILIFLIYSITLPINMCTQSERIVVCMFLLINH